MIGRLRALVAGGRLAVGPAILFAVAAGFGSLMFSFGSTASGQQALVSTNPADIAAGEVLYTAHCESCHGYEGQGGQNGSPELINVGAAAANFYLTTGRMPLNAPDNQAIRHHPFFDPTQIRQLVAYINALPVINGMPNNTGPTIPTIDPLCPGPTVPNPNPTHCVTLAEGQRLFAINCAQCHQAAGAGGMLSKGNVIPSLKDANATQVAEALRIGPKPMPIFSTYQISPQQASAIAQYVEWLHSHGNPGGLTISHFGPVAEGFVGILGGFCVIWFAARMIGNRG